MQELASKYTSAIKAAVEASHKIMGIYENEFDTIIKDDGSPLTKADLASTKIIHEHLEPLGIPITGEETDKTYNTDTSHQHHLGDIFSLYLLCAL